MKFNFLELDHVEVINGIHAKYYKLSKTSFAISIKDTDDTMMYKQLTQVHHFVGRLIDDFKDEFMKASSYALENRLENDHEVGMLSSTGVYLSEEEFDELSTYLSQIVKKHQKMDENKKYYIYIGGLARKSD